MRYNRYTVPFSHTSLARSSRTIRSRLFGLGASTTAVVFFGAVTLAPYSTSTAFAAESNAAVINAQGSQALVSETATDQVLGLEVSTVSAPAAEVEAPSQASGQAATAALYTLQQFMFSGVVNWGGYKFTYYSQQVLPGGGLQIPGRHVSAGGYVSDGDGYIVLAGSAPKGTVYDTPFGAQGKIYDRGTVGNHLDVYIR